MSKGKLVSQKTKDGYQYKIEYQKDNKIKSIQIPITFPNEEYNGKECSFEQESGKLIKVEVEGQIIYPQSNSKNTKKENSKVSEKNNVNNNQSSSIESKNQNFNLPKDTLELIKNIKIDNYALHFHKFVKFINNKAKAPDFDIFDIEDQKIINEIIEKQKRLLSIYEPNYRFEKQLKTSWRLAIGLGHESVYETSMTFHYIYGLPYIPSTSIKGVVRSCIINQNFDNNEIKAISESETFCKIFGCPDEIKDENAKIKYPSAIRNEKGKPLAYQGEIIFFDAFPTNCPKIKIDIMNPHFQEYYKDGKTPPMDHFSPIPIEFLTVEDTTFRFAIASRKRPLEEYIIGDKNIINWFVESLEKHGIGAKTAVGYGYFNE